MCGRKKEYLHLYESLYYIGIKENYTNWNNWERWTKEILRSDSNVLLLLNKVILGAPHFLI